MYEIVNTGGEVELGTYSIGDDSELINLYMAMIFYETSSFTNEQVRVRVERSDAVSSPLYSDWITVKTFIDGFTDTDHWIGNILFSFSREQINSSTTYTLYLETNNYTHDALGIQIGTIINFINPSTGAFEVTSNRAAYNTTFSYR